MAARPRACMLPRPGLERIITGAAEGVQNLAYQFDKLGNLEPRADLAQGPQEEFQYDDLNRLKATTTHAGSGTVTQTVGCDALGNIETKSHLTGSAKDQHRLHRQFASSAWTF